MVETLRAEGVTVGLIFRGLNVTINAKLLGTQAAAHGGLGVGLRTYRAECEVVGDVRLSDVRRLG